MKFKLSASGLIASVFLMILTIPYTIYSYFDTTIPFDDELLLYSAVAIILFAINLYYFKNRRKES